MCTVLILCRTIASDETGEVVPTAMRRERQPGDNSSVRDGAARLPYVSET
jgi:hypothetical protein